MITNSLPTAPPVTSAPSIHWIPGIYLATEADIVENFLGADLGAICAAASDSKEMLFIATAGQPLQKRKEALVVWRKKILTQVMETSEARNFLQFAPADLREDILSGNVSFAEADAAINAIIEAATAEREAARVASKARMSAACKALLLDGDSQTGRVQVPQFIVIREDGQSGMFLRSTAARDFAKAGNGRYLILTIDPSITVQNDGPDGAI